jgi:prepilin-type N-terminal cleavage/methylation domain-containing protein
VPLVRRASLRGARGLTLTELIVTLALFAVVMVGVGAAWGKAQEMYFVGAETAEVQQNLRAAIDFMAREIRSAGRDTTSCAFDYATATTTDCDDTKVTECSTRLAGTGHPSWESHNGLGGPGCAGLSAIPFTEARADTLRIRSDRNQNGRIAGRGNSISSPASAADRAEEDVLYALSTANCPPGVSRCITRNDGTGAVAMVAVDVAGLTFTYYPRPNFGPCAALAHPCDIAFRLPLTSQAQADNIGRIRISVEARQQAAGQTVSRGLVTDVTLRNRS